MDEFFVEHWESINWPTAITVLVLLTPICIGLFKLIASHSREALKSANAAHKAEILKLRKEYADADGEFDIEEVVRTGWQYVELSDEEKTVLIAISKNELSFLYGTGQISDQRIGFAIGRLGNVQFISDGPGGHYALQSGREWLNAKGLLT